MVEQELQQLIEAIPDILWLRIISVDGVVHPAYRYDAGSIKRGNTDLEREEDRKSAMTAAGFSLSARISYELRLGESRFSIVAGRQGISFLLPVGDGADWLLAFVVRGQPAIDPIIQYFRDRDYLASIAPLL
jgi:predicted regulator of Ras-like GTPase activity (Roadblock/LC7/MglB family)